MPKLQGGQARVLSQDEFEVLLQVIGTTIHAKRDILMMRLSYNLGLRAVEIAGLKISDVLNLDGTVVSELRITKTKRTKKKNGSDEKEAKTRTLQLPDPRENNRIQQAILDYIEERKKYCAKQRIDFDLNSPLILSQWNNRFTNKGITQRCATLYKLAEFERASSHSGRRSFATVLQNMGATLAEIKYAMGHENIATTILYIDSNPDKQRELFTKITY